MHDEYHPRHALKVQNHLLEDSAVITVSMSRAIILVAPKKKPSFQDNLTFERNLTLHFPKVPNIRSVDDASRKDETNSEVHPTKKVLTDYMNSTSTHGIKYLGVFPFTIGKIDKFVWFFIMILVTIGLAFMMDRYLKVFMDNPAKLYIRSFHVPISEAPYPAVTICPLTSPPLTRQLAVFNSLKIPENISTEEAMFIFKYGSDLSHANIFARAKHKEIMKKLLKFNDIKLIDFLKLLRSCSDLLESCWWNHERINCFEYLRLSHTSKGLCCSFNYILEENIGKSRIEREKFQELHTSYYGAMSGLAIILKEDVFEDHGIKNITMTFGHSISAMIYVHYNMEYPSNQVSTYSLQAGKELHIRVRPVITRRMAETYQYESDDKSLGCISDLYKLHFFPEYRYVNCLIDCKLDIIIKFCGCVHYYYAPYVNTSIPLCDLNELDCLYKNNNALRRQILSCLCQSPCNEIEYDIRANSIILKKHKYAASAIYQNMSYRKAVLKVYMSSHIFTEIESAVSVEIWDFLATVGGFFSLFLGCSMISFAEIIYFGILFLCSSSRKTKTRKIK